tara:strand:- start:7933 stop:9201 length:1269 start_codon:yes stop_codon:yes gene_type:complete
MSFNSSKYNKNNRPGSVGTVDETKTVDERTGQETVHPAQKHRISNYMPHYVDFTDAYANAGKVIRVEHVPSGDKTAFKAFITSFNETYNSSWNEENVYGRADPIVMFKNTQRSITLAFKVPAATESEAFENLGKIQKLAQYLYPYYDNTSDASTITQSPLVRIQLMNLIANQAKWAKGIKADPDGNVNPRPTGQYGMTFQEMDNTYGSAPKYEATGHSEGLLGIITNLTFAHNLETEAGVLEMGDNILPKVIEVNMDFRPLHETPLGWVSQTGGKVKFRSQAWPYGIDTTNTPELATDNLQDLISQNAKRLSLDPAQSGSLLYQQNQQEEFESIAQQTVENAQARYAGALGSLRSKLDSRRIEKGFSDRAIASGRAADISTLYQVNAIYENNPGIDMTTADDGQYIANLHGNISAASFIGDD